MEIIDRIIKNNLSKYSEKFKDIISNYNGKNAYDEIEYIFNYKIIQREDHKKGDIFNDTCSICSTGEIPYYKIKFITVGEEKIYLCDTCIMKIKSPIMKEYFNRKYDELEKTPIIRITSCKGEKCSNFKTISDDAEIRAELYGWRKDSQYQIIYPAFCDLTGNLLHQKENNKHLWNKNAENIYYADKECPNITEVGDIEIDVTGKVFNSVMCPLSQERCYGLECPKIRHKDNKKTKTVYESTCVDSIFMRNIPITRSYEKEYTDGTIEGLFRCGLNYKKGE